MILERKDLDSLVDRLMKRGLSEEGAKRIVYAYFDATMKTLKDGEELPLLDSKYLYQKREGDKINIYSKKVKEKEFYEKITSAGADAVIGGLAGILGTIKLIYLLRKEGKNKMAKKYEVGGKRKMKFKKSLTIPLLIGLSFFTFSCSNPMKDLKSGIKEKVEAYEKVFKKMKPEKRKDFIALLEKGLAITEQQHEKDLRSIVEMFKEYQKGDKDKGYLVLLSDEDYKDYKNKVFNNKKEIVSFLSDTKEHAAVYVSENNILTTHYMKEKCNIHFELIDYNANGMHEDEEDLIWARTFTPLMIVCYDFKGNYKSLKEEDEAKATYKIVIHDITEMLNNKTDLGCLIEKYRKEKEEKNY